VYCTISIKNTEPEQSGFFIFSESMILLAKKNLQLAFIAVGVCEVMKVLIDAGPS